MSMPKEDTLFGMSARSLKISTLRLVCTDMTQYMLSAKRPKSSAFVNNNHYQLVNSIEA